MGVLASSKLKKSSFHSWRDLAENFYFYIQMNNYYFQVFMDVHPFTQNPRFEDVIPVEYLWRYVFSAEGF